MPQENINSPGPGLKSLFFGFKVLVKCVNLWHTTVFCSDFLKAQNTYLSRGKCRFEFYFDLAPEISKQHNDLPNLEAKPISHNVSVMACFRHHRF